MNIFKPVNDVYIKGPAVYLPEKTIANKDIIHYTNADVSPTVIGFSTGIRKRHWAKEDEACSDLAIHAVKKLLDETGVQKSEIGQLILATISGDYVSPPTSPLIQHQLDLNHIGVFDVGAACAGFVVGLHVSAALAQSMNKDCLLIASEVRSKFLNPKDFGTSALFGDGAAACLVTKRRQHADFKILASGMYADGEVADLVSVPAGGSRLPAATCNDPDKHYISVKDNSALFIKAVEGMVSAASIFLKELQLRPEEFDWIVPHQGNKHLLTAVCSQLGIPESKLINVVSETGNTSGASVGIALEALKKNPSLKKGDRILLLAAGGGGIAACSDIIFL